MDFILSESDSEASQNNISIAPEIDIRPKPETLQETKKLQKKEISEFEFKKQLYTYENFGYSNNPVNTQEIIVDPMYFNSNLISSTLNPQFPSVFQKSSTERKEFKKSLHSQRLVNDDPSSPDFKGPWAVYKSELEFLSGRSQELTNEQKENLEKMQKKKDEWDETEVVPKRKIDYEKTPIVKQEPSVAVHLDLEPDYQNRSIFVPPSDLKHDPNTVAYLPKKCVKTLKGHKEGVQCVKFHKDGHLMLSCSLDKTIKIWDVVSNKKCIQTYSGHSNTVRDICWSLDNTSFLSTSYDRVIRHWDTETGKVLCTFTCRRIPYCVRFNPNPEKQTSFIVGTANKRIIEYDTNSGKKERIYEEHLGAVNSICFLDDNKKFISTSDDKKIYLWEFGIPIVTKHISEPNLHAVPYTVLHPSNRHFLGQCLDNKLIVFEAKGGFRLNRRKKFVGHMNGGYACAVSVSPDGQFVTCGDANGKLWFWDWKTTKNYRTLQAHDSVVIGTDWHPIYPSTIATCSWDGLIKIWD